MWPVGWVCGGPARGLRRRRLEIEKLLARFMVARSFAGAEKS